MQQKTNWFLSVSPFLPGTRTLFMFGMQRKTSLKEDVVCQTCLKSDFDDAVISKYVLELTVWQDITSFDSGLRERVCLVASDNFIYFIGGGVR